MAPRPHSPSGHAAGFGPDRPARVMILAPVLGLGLWAGILSLIF